MSAASTNVVYRRIAADLRAEILAGTLPAGAQMPTREELMGRYRTTKVTVQKAFDLLSAQGWVGAEGRRGTFVKAQANRRDDYALVFPWPWRQDTSQFYRALRQQAEQLTNSRRRITCFYEIQRTDSEDSLRLDALVRAHRLAGVIFASNPFDAEGLPVLEEPGVPRVMIASAVSGFPIPVVSPNLEAFWERVLDHLAAAGRRRVAVIALADPGPVAPYLLNMQALAAARGLTIERRWLQGVPSTAPAWAQHAAEILLQGGPTQRPDALVIADDNLVPTATAGLQAAGARVPADELVIAHTNFPYPTPAAVPVTRVGFEISRLLELCVERINQQRRGETPAAMTELPAVFEGEVTEAQTQAATALMPGRQMADVQGS